MKTAVKIPPLSKEAYILFRILLLPVFLIFAYSAVYFLSTPIITRAWVISEIYTMLEYATLSFTLLFCGVLLFDIGLKKGFIL